MIGDPAAELIDAELGGGEVTGGHGIEFTARPRGIELYASNGAGGTPTMRPIAGELIMISRSI